MVAYLKVRKLGPLLFVVLILVSVYSFTISGLVRPRIKYVDDTAALEILSQCPESLGIRVDAKRNRNKNACGNKRIRIRVDGASGKFW